jgi:hypothetical protein
MLGQKKPHQLKGGVKDRICLLDQMIRKLDKNPGIVH